MNKLQLRAIENQLERIAKKNNGEVTPDEVVELARDPKNPMHDQFEWDDSKAAHLHRIDQARALIRSIRVVVTIDKKRVESVAYVHNPDRGREQGYKHVSKLRTQKDSARDALMNELVRANSVMHRALEIAGTLGLADEVKELIIGLESLRNQLVA